MQTDRDVHGLLCREIQPLRNSVLNCVFGNPVLIIPGQGREGLPVIGIDFRCHINPESFFAIDVDNGPVIDNSLKAQRFYF